MLQPMIENAVFHGFENLQEMGQLRIMIKKEDDTIVFKVRDNGQGFDETKLKSILGEDQQKADMQRFNSIGLSNVHKRIKLHFGEKYGLNIRSTLSKGTEVTIVIPAIVINTDSKGDGSENTDS
jgi:two-component system sensor histidine kinase YesM